MADTTPELPIALMNRWKENWTSTLIKVSILTVILLVCLILMFTLGNLNEIAKNFPKYRCNPMIMPFAGNFGYDTKENFNFCLTSIFNNKAAEIFTPIYGLLGGFTDIVNLIVNVAAGIRKLFSNFFGGVNSFIRNVRDRIQAVMFSIRMSFLKLNNLMGRVYGTMYAVIWMGTSAMTAGFNLADNNLVRFLFEFCFDPDTKIPLQNGSYKRISEIQIGDSLLSVGNHIPVVTSVLRFSGKRTQMVQIRDVIMSSQHYVIDSNNKWIPANSHDESAIAASIPELVCINVTGHKFRIGAKGLIVADYDEHSNEQVTDSTQKLAMYALNGKSTENDAVSEYSLGIDGSSFVRMENNQWKPISSVRIGEQLWNAGAILGIVKEQCPTIVEHNGSVFSVAQTIFNSESKQWERAGSRWPTKIVEKNTILYSLITQNCGTIHVSINDGSEYYIRDYREVPLTEMEDAYSTEFEKSLL